MIRVDLLEKKPGAARALIDQRLARTPGDAAVLVLGARVDIATGDLPGAEALLRRAIEADPSHLVAYSLLGSIYAQTHRMAEARQSFEAMLARQPDSVPINTIVAVLYEMGGDRPEARRRYERILKIDPEAAVAANNLAYIYVEDGGNLDIALNLAQVAARKLPDSPQAADTLGWVYVKRDLPTLAVPQLEQAVAKAPSDALLRYHLGVALSQAGAGIRSREVLQEALRLKLSGPDADAARALLQEP